MKIKAKSLSLSLPFGLGGIVIEPNEAEQKAAWALYVELTTRVATQPFDDQTGSLRAVLSSLHTVFGLTRQILREAGPSVAHGHNAFGPIAIDALTRGIAPFTTRWHLPLLEYEQRRSPEATLLDYERAWPHYQTMRAELHELQKQMRIYADLLAEIAGAKGME